MAPTPSPWPFPWPLVQGDLDFTLPPLSDDAGHHQHHHQHDPQDPQRHQGNSILLGESYAAMSGMGDETVRGGKPIFAGRTPCDLDFPANPLAALPLPKSAPAAPSSRRAKKPFVSGGVRKAKSQENITQSPKATKTASAKAGPAGKKSSARKKKSSSSWSAGSAESGETKFIGISQYRRKKWEAHVWAKGGTPEGGEKGRQLHLGYFTSPVNAARAYDRAALFLRGPEAARLNFGALVYADDAIMSELKRVKREDFLTKLRALSAEEEERDSQSASTYTTGALDLGPALAGLSQQCGVTSFMSDATVKGGVPKGRGGRQTAAPSGSRSGTSKRGPRVKVLGNVEEDRSVAGRGKNKAHPGMGISPNTTLLGIPLFTYTGESGLGDHYLSMRSHIPVTQSTSACSGWALSDQASRLSLHQQHHQHQHHQHQHHQQEEVPDYLVSPPGLPTEPFEAMKEFLHSEVGMPVSCAMTGEACVSGTGGQDGIFDDHMVQMTHMSAAEIMGTGMEASAVTVVGTGHHKLATDTQGSIGNYTFFDAL